MKWMDRFAAKYKKDAEDAMARDGILPPDKTYSEIMNREEIKFPPKKATILQMTLEDGKYESENVEVLDWSEEMGDRMAEVMLLEYKKRGIIRQDAILCQPGVKGKASLADAHREECRRLGLM
jgi:hypothetical protein